MMMMIIKTEPGANKRYKTETLIMMIKLIGIVLL